MKVVSNKMNKYAYSLMKEIQSLLEDENEITIDTKIAEIFSEDFDELSWIIVLIRLELIYGINIPDEWSELTNLTIMEFGKKLSSLIIIPEALYPEYYELKILMFDYIKREIKIIKGLEDGTIEELLEIRAKLNEIEQRLSQIVEFPRN